MNLNGKKAMQNRKENPNQGGAKYSVRVVVLTCLLLCFVGIVNHDLWTPDEPRVAAVSLAMSRSHNLVVPMLASQPFVEKPPLYFAVAGWFIKVFGPVFGDTGAIRLSTTFWALGILLMTYLLGRRLLAPGKAWLALGVMATMEGFFENAHWIRVDAALSFFVIAAIWALVEVYFKQRRWAAVLAGIFAAGAFLSKGPIGLIMIAAAWIVMFMQTLFLGGEQGLGIRLKGVGRRFLSVGIVPHLLAVVVLLALVAPWVYLIHASGKGIWQEWFWDNQVGRLTGTAQNLSHIRRNPLYYVTTLLLYSLPWTPLLIPWFWDKLKKWFKRQPLSPLEIFLSGWSVVGLAILTSSATKRSIYIWPMMPVFALIVADQLINYKDKWLPVYTRAWQILMAVVLLVLGGLPLLGKLVPAFADIIPPRSGAVLLTFGSLHMVALLLGAILLGIHFATRGREFRPTAMIFATALFLGGVCLLAQPALDREKSMRDGLLAFVDAIPVAERSSVASFGLNETMRAIFYYYADWSIDRLDAHTMGGDRETELANGRRQVALILEGKDPTYRSVVYASKRPGIHIGNDMPAAKTLQVEQLNRDRWLARFGPPEGK